MWNFRAYWICPFAVLLAVLSACGGNAADANEERVDAGASTSTVADNPATNATTPLEATTSEGVTPTSSVAEEPDPDAWVAEVNEALNAMRIGQRRAVAMHAIALEDPANWGSLDVESDRWRADGEAYSALASAFPSGPDEFADLADVFVSAADDAGQIHLETADELSADEALQAAAVEDGASVDLDGYLSRQIESFAKLEQACFDLQDAVVATGSAVIDCAGSTNLPFSASDCLLMKEAFGEEIPCSENGGNESASQSLETLEPGVPALFDDFSRPFTITVDDPVTVVGGRSEIEFAPTNKTYLERFFWLLALDEIADPTVMVADSFAIDKTVKVPANLSEWLEHLPIAIAEEGVSTFGDLDVPYWRLEPAAERTSAEGLESYAFTSTETNGVHIFRRGTIFWQVPHPDGAMVIVATPVNESPDAASAQEKFDFVESTIRALEIA